MSHFPILSLMLLVPLIGAVISLLSGRDTARKVALLATLVDLALGVVLWLQYDIGGAQWQFQEHAALFAGFEWKLGIDGIALLLIALTVFLMPICIGASWNSIEKRAGEYYAAFLLMETLMIGVFTAQDLFLFYIMFEAGLIPMYLIIGIWGGAERIYASYKFFLYTLLGSVLMLIAMFWMANQAGTTDITPKAFTDALTFEQQVQAAATAQGYSAGDIFVTGHSLGGWEAEYVAQQRGLDGIGFESPGISTTVAGNGADSGFVNVESYGDPAAYMSTDLAGLQPFEPAYVPGGGSFPHYGSIVMIGDPNATTPLIDASAKWGSGLRADAVFGLVLGGNFLEHHLPGMQAYNLGVSPDPGVVPWLGATAGPVDAGYGNLTIPQLEDTASQAGTLITP